MQMLSFIKKQRGYLIIALVIIAAISSYVAYNQFNGKLSQTTNSSDEVKKTIAAAQKLIELPQGETPTLATVSDKSKLSSEAFFAHAENGDKVLLYSKAKKAFLYRPGDNKIIEVASLNVPVAQATTNPVLGATDKVTPSVSPVPVTISILNGTKTKGLANTVATQIQERDPSLIVKTKGNAASDYKQTTIVSLTEAGKAKAGDVASIVNGTIGDLPQGETKPNTDLLVILGGS